MLTGLSKLSGITYFSLQKKIVALRHLMTNGSILHYIHIITLELFREN